MKDVITILVCNAIRQADHQRNVLGRQLTDSEVMSIAVRVQMDYHRAEYHRMEKQNSVNTEAQKPVLTLSGSVQPPSDMLEAARKTLGERFPEFIEKHGEQFTPKQLCDFLEAA